MIENNKFNSLTPEVLQKNKTIYTEALDYAFSNSDIKNIAITGIYGAGKSTVWNTYAAEKKLSDVITVSLGNYKNDIKDDDRILTNHLKSVNDEAENEKIYGGQETDDIDDDNRVERQLINQILSQIESKKIPLSKYSFKSNKSTLNIFMQSLLFMSMIFSILLWIIRADFISFVSESYKEFSGTSLILICAVLLFAPLLYYFYTFNRWNRFKISKVTFKGAEANVNDISSDESVLDRDIKELVYLLRSSGSKIVVFEDLDRYDNTSIYIKLRELNFLLNKYVRVNDVNELPVRFIYMLKDGLFYSKNRTKFFDFILPIVPVVDSKTSENELLELLKNVEKAPDKDVLADISLYVDDMRLLKNIVNEYIVYSKIIPLEHLELDKNKLFAMITLKNIFPNEFDLLQEDKGFIRTVFDRLESERKTVVNNLKQKLDEIDENIKFINSRIENDKFEAMALRISTDVRPYNAQHKTMSQFLKDWSEEPEKSVDIRYPSGSKYCTYKEFVDNYVLNNEKNRTFIEKFPEDFSVGMNKLNSDREKIKKQIKDVDIYRYKEIISGLTIEQREELFLIDGFDISKSHYFPLVRFLIVDGLLDETYWYYKGNFNVDKSNILKRNDTIYMKGLKEGKALDIFLDIETPEEILRRLKLSDFSRFNILNKKVLETCLEQKQTKMVEALVESVDINDNYKDLLKILNEFNLDILKIYTDILLENNIGILINTLDFCGHENIETLKNILISVLTNKTIESDDLLMFKVFIEENENIISIIPEADFSIFIDNICSEDIKFEDMSEANCTKERLEAIEKIQAYRLNIRNLIFISEAILEKNISYGNLLGDIYNCEQLSSSVEYIENDFERIVVDYIDENHSKINYTNNEDILLKILNSNISDEHKLQYLDKNETVISDLSNIQKDYATAQILNLLLSKNKVEFNSDNIASYWDMVEEYSDSFIEYLDNNLNENNNEDILKNNISISNAVINSPDVSDKIFVFVIKYATEQISNLDPKLNQSRVNTLVKHSLIDHTENNLKVLLDNEYNAEITLIANGNDEEAEIRFIDMLLKHELSDELIYDLVNSSISDKSSLALINSIKDTVLIEKINPTKESIIKEILNGDLSLENVNYICNNFTRFTLKDEFIESLDSEGKLEELKNQNLNENFMNHVLKSQSVNVDTKVSLIVTKINNRSDIEYLEQYILLIPEIAELSNVWHNGRPKLDNVYKKQVGEALIKFGYVSKRNDKDCMRVERKKVKTDKLKEYLL